MKSLNTQNAETASLIVNKLHPEWGTWRLIYNGQQLNDNKFTHIIIGDRGSKILDEGEFKFWSITTTEEYNKTWSK